MNMDEYIKNYEQYTKKVVYHFRLGCGGIGDFIKFFMYTLTWCIKYKYKCYYLINNNLVIEKYIKLKHKQMYIDWKDIQNFRNIGVSDFPHLSDDIYNMIEPLGLFSAYEDNFIDMNIQDVFEFSNEVLKNSHNLLDTNMTNYMSIHLRLGDKYLETDKEFIRCKADERKYNENNLFNCIETNKDKNIIFFCDNNSYKLKIKKLYDHIIICNCDIGHTDLYNTTDKQILDTLTELYLLTNSEKIYYASVSGFSFVASKFKNIPLINILSDITRD
jgi:hypothetical protein